MNGDHLAGLLMRLDEAHVEEQEFNRETYGERYFDPEESTLYSEAARAIRDLTAGDEPWPVPGKPETYSERYNVFHRMLNQPDPLTQLQAIKVWNAKHALMGAIPEGRLIDSLNRNLTVELSEGLRCSVCGKYRDGSCTLDC